MKGSFAFTMDRKFPLMRKIMENNLSLVYYGDFSDKVNDALIPFAESLIGQAESGFLTRKRAFYILVECIQNINRHHAKSEKPANFPREIFIVKEQKNRFYFTLGNVMETEKVKSLDSKLTKLNNLSEGAKNQYHKSILNENVLTHRGGAGLGLIEIARKSGDEIKFHFDKLDEAFSYFSMETHIDDFELGKSTNGAKGLKEVKQLRNYYKNHHFGLLFKSPFGFHSLSQVISVINYLNNLEEHHFITNDQMAGFLNEVQFFLKGLCKTESIVTKENMVFHFEHQNGSKRFNITWVAPEKLAKRCKKILMESFPETHGQPKKNSPSGEFTKALKGLSGKHSKYINLSTQLYKKNQTLFSLNIPIK